MAHEKNLLGFSTITINPDHRETALKDLMSQYGRSPRILALVQAIAHGANFLEEDLFDLQVGRTLEAAGGPQLDQWGILVDEKRGGLLDHQYRNFIMAKILSLISDGTVDTLIQIFQLVTGGEEVRYFSNYPAGFTLAVYLPFALSDKLRRRVRRTMGHARPAGVNMILIEATLDALALDHEEPGLGEAELSRII